MGPPYHTPSALQLAAAASWVKALTTARRPYALPVETTVAPSVKIALSPVQFEMELLVVATDLLHRRKPSVIVYHKAHPVPSLKLL